MITGFQAGVMATGRPLFTPANASPSIYYDASVYSSLTLNGANVGQWNDLSGNSRHAAQSTDSARPQYSATGINSLPAVVFDSNTEILGMDALSLTNNIGAVAIFALAQLPDVALTGYDALIQFRNWSSDRATLYLRYSLIEAGGRRLDYDGYQLHTFGTPANNTPVLIYCGFDYANAALGGSVNGGTVSFRSGGFQTAGNTSATNSVGTSIGSSNSTANSTTHTGAHISNAIACAVVFTRIPTTTERQKIEGYMAHTWGLTANLPSDHPYRNSPPTV